MSIDEAWHRLESGSDALKAEANDVQRAILKSKSAKSMYLPSVSLTGSYTHLSEPVNVDTSSLSSALAGLPIPLPFPSQIDFTEQDIFLADLNLLWPLYTGGKIDAAQDIYAAALSEAKAKEAMKRDVEFLKLIKYYYGVVVSKSLLKTREEAQKALLIHYENAKKLKEMGQIAEIELLNAEVKLDAARIETTKAKHKLEIAYAALASLTSSNDALTSKLFITGSLGSQEEYTRETQHNYAPLKILNAKEQQSKALIKIKEASWHPEVMAYGSLNLYRDDSPLMETLPNWFAGVLVKIDLLQREDRAQEVEIAELLHSKVKHLHKQALKDLALLVEKTYKEMLSDYEEYYALSSSIALAQENYRLRSISFREGLSTSVELVDAQMFLLGAKTERLNAAYNFVQKISQLSVLRGNRALFFSTAAASKEVE
jgi:outer membrane protein TolC